MSVALRHAPWWLGVLVAGPAVALAQSVTGEFERRLEIDEPLALEVTTGSGTITIAAGEPGRAVIIGAIRARPSFGRDAEETEALVRDLESNPPIELAAGVLRVGRLDGDWERNLSISYEIRVPASTTVSSRTGSGDQRISGLTAAVAASTGSGSMTLAELGAVDARTGSGTIRLTQASPGDVSLATGSGDADVRGADGALRVRTGSGSIAVEGAPSESWDLQTGSGSIRVQLPADSGFELDARTGSGEVFTAHPIQFQGRIDRSRVLGQVRDGGAPLRMRTGSGDIRIE